MSATLVSRLPEVIASLAPRVAAGLGAGAEAVAADAAERVPDPPAPGEGIVAAIHVEKQGELEFAVLAGDDDVFYAHMVEFGTSHSAPRPFLVPALEANRGTVAEYVAAALRGL